jgi:hypothetical protein
MRAQPVAAFQKSGAFCLAQLNVLGHAQQQQVLKVS